MIRLILRSPSAALSAKIAVVAIAVATQMIMLGGNGLVFFFPIVFIGAAFHALVGIARRHGMRGERTWWFSWLGWVFWLLPIVTEFAFVLMFGLRGLAIILISGFVGTLVTAGGSLLVPLLCMISILPPLTFSIERAKYFIPVLLILLIVAAFRARKGKWKFKMFPAPVRFFIFMLYGSLGFFLYWYTWPGMLKPIDLGNDPAIRHLEGFERMALRTPFPRSFYSVIENCSGDTLFLTNLFSSPGVLHARRGEDDVTRRNEILGTAEQLVFDCAQDLAYVAEYRTGRFLVYQGDDLQTRLSAYHTPILDPCRIAHYPGSNLFYINGDEESFPWYIVDKKGGLLLKFEIGSVEEIIPLADDGFITSFNGVVRHLRLDVQKRELVTIQEIRLPDKGLAAIRLGPLFQHLAYDERDGLVFVSDFNTGKIYGVDFADESVRTLARPGRGVRHLAYSPERDVIAVGNYVTGVISIIERASGDTIYEKNIGSRLRGVTVSRDGERFYAVSRGGVFEISLAQLNAPGK